MRSWAVWVGLLVGPTVPLGCGPTTQPKPTTESKPAAVDDQFTGFVFGPTMRGEAPSNLEVRPVAEIGVAHERRMSAIVVGFGGDRAPSLSIDLWSFEQTGAEDVLQAKGPPSLLIDPHGGADVDAEILRKLRSDLALPRAASTIPQGIEAEDATAALTSLHVAGIAALDVTGEGSVRAKALVTVIRGLDIEVWLSARLPKVLKMLAHPTFEIFSSHSTSRRSAASVRSNGQTLKIESVRKSDGWVLMTATAD